MSEPTNPADEPFSVAPAPPFPAAEYIVMIIDARLRWANEMYRKRLIKGSELTCRLFEDYGRTCDRFLKTFDDRLTARSTSNRNDRSLHESCMTARSHC